MQITIPQSLFLVKNDINSIEEFYGDPYFKDIINNYKKNLLSIDKIYTTLVNYCKDLELEKYVVYYDLNDFANMSIDKSLIKYYNPVLRFSTQWYSPGDFADIDSYCFEPNNTVCPDFPEADTGVVLFNDYVGNSNPVATEHIIYISKNLMTPGTYTFKVRDCDGWSSNNGFISEIEFDNKTYSYEYKQKIGYNKFVEVAKVTLSDGEFTISHTLPVTVKT